MLRNIKTNQRGAVAVEFALLLPALLLLIVGIIEFSRIYNAQIMVTNAAREAARTMAVQHSIPLAQAAAQAAAGPYSVTTNVPLCTAGNPANATVSTTIKTLTGNWMKLGNTITLKASGSMLCEK